METIIVYGSRRGTTKYCAALIKDNLGKDCRLFDVRDGVPQEDLERCDNMIIGANAFKFRLNKQVSAFVCDHLNTIMKKNVYLFICSGSELGDDTISLYKASYPPELMKAAESMENFGGRLDLSKESWFMRFILKRMRMKEYDTVNPDTIDKWASELPFSVMGAGHE